MSEIVRDFYPPDKLCPLTGDECFSSLIAPHSGHKWAFSTDRKLLAAFSTWQGVNLFTWSARVIKPYMFPQCLWRDIKIEEHHGNLEADTK